MGKTEKNERARNTTNANKGEKPRRAKNNMKKPAVEKNDKSFEFKNAVRILKATGRKASTLQELRDNIAEVSEESIFFHTYQYFSKGLILEYTNDFAEWVAVNLEESTLAEHLSNIDSFSHTSMEDLRAELLRVIDHYIENFPAPRSALPGNEFYFTETVSFIFPAGIKARNLAEFLMALKYLTTDSIYYHFFEARERLAKGADDFTKWLDEVIGAVDLVKEIRSIDPFMYPIEGIRQQLTLMLEKELKKQMEVI